ncbi:hypothetical protein MC7420_5984 [Coleofasciculus chthonoplastes PCC 7420]|uniref:Uncharacterized protein n=1 Tax=Coleofasciculus chthonoplastes PCC 7420 TaxID=118168 RepID=B4W5C8_9CYAN|nr:hypothetical protein MC7420_5984 [Coleofasciculus chthonoplastes PCC 7420]
MERPVTVYKEYRAEGKLSGNGIFAPGITDNTRFKLILQSTGNRCMSTIVETRHGASLHK